MKKLSFILLGVLVWACDPCSRVDCVNGICEEGTCICDAGWTGTNCDQDMCAGINCNNGTCVNGICQCNQNYTGTYCDQIVDPCYQVDCGDHGECVEGDCECDDAWEGDSCETFNGCVNTCSWAGDGWCDDGGEDSDFNVCDCGTDCDDCGPRTLAQCTGPDAAIAVWTAMTTFPCNTQLIDVYIGTNEDDKTYQGSLDSYCTGDPACNDACTVTIPVIHGTYYLYAECNDGDIYWDGNVSVDEGYCNLIELTNDKKIRIIKTLRSKK